jgi:hypothetical protein
MSRSLAAIVLCLTLGGCATTSGYETVLNSWVGDTTDHLVSVWGIPANQYALNDGGRVLEYDRSNTVVIPGVTTVQPVATTYTNGSLNGNINGSYSGTSTTYAPVTSAPTAIHQQCITRFTADNHGRITRWSWQGNSCRARAPKAVTAAAVQAPVPAYKQCTAAQLRSGECS